MATKGQPAPTSRDDYSWQDPWKGATVGDFILEFARLGLSAGSALKILPESQRAVIVYTAATHVQFIPGAFRRGVDYQLVQTVMHNIATGMGAVDELNDSGWAVFSLAVFPICIGYFATQFLYYRNVDSVEVDLPTLKARLLEASLRRIESIIPPRVDGILSAVLDRLLLPATIKQLQNVPDIDVLRQDLESYLLRELAAGSAIWQIADSLRFPVDPATMVSGKVFISYATRDAKRIKRFEKYIKESGVAVWRDEKDILPGEPILDRVREGILSESDAIAIFVSAVSVDSEWVKAELRLAYNREITSKRILIIPILLDDCPIPAELKIKKYIDARKSTKRAAEELVKAVQAHLHGSARA